MTAGPPIAGAASPPVTAKAIALRAIKTFLFKYLDLPSRAFSDSMKYVFQAQFF